MLGSSLCLRKVREARSVTVSMLSIVSKILEMAVYTQLESYLVKKKLLFDFQPGFRSNFKTDSCLTYLTDYIKTQTSKGLYTACSCWIYKKLLILLTMTFCARN